jgi:hypothetical protein
VRLGEGGLLCERRTTLPNGTHTVATIHFRFTLATASAGTTQWFASPDSSPVETRVLPLLLRTACWEASTPARVRVHAYHRALGELQRRWALAGAYWVLQAHPLPCRRLSLEQDIDT